MNTLYTSETQTKTNNLIASNYSLIVVSENSTIYVQNKKFSSSQKIEITDSISISTKNIQSLPIKKE